jgi:2-keto-4-pentenoate hydratase/2-oxohepta-3-ene-1,7-dioic acid hydratase in catechol pathway
MKLSTFEVKTLLGAFQRIGVVLFPQGENMPVLVDLNAAYCWMLAEADQKPEPQRWADFLFPTDMRAFLELGNPALDTAREVEQRFQDILKNSQPEELVGHQGQRLAFHQSEVTLKTPIPNPKMMRDFLSFETHTANGFKRRNEPIPEAWYKMPVYYKGNPHTLIGHEEIVHWPNYTRIMDYELELACVIGKEGKNIPAEKAADYIVGYAIMNDFSARDIQKYEMMCRLGPAKGKDFCTSVGPWLVTADEVKNPRDLRMIARINGEVWSDGNAGTSHWTFEQMIEHVSKEELVYPGDILGSGTVGFGCGLELDRWIQPGDIVELEITGLGILRNQVIKPESTSPNV